MSITNDANAGEETPNCFQCRFFYVSFDNNRPYACRAMGFKSREMPSLEVFRAAGSKCLSFRARRRSNSRRKSSKDHLVNRTC